MSSFESLKREHTVEIGSDRSFGLVFTGFFCILGLYPVYRGDSVRIWCLGVALVFLGLTVVKPALLRPLNTLWARLGILIGTVTTPIFLGILFYGVVTPVGLILKMVGKDQLGLKKNDQIATYWVERKPPGPSPESMVNQF